MDHSEKYPDSSLGHQADVVAEALAYARKAEELRGTAIKQLLEQRERIQEALKTLGYLAPASAISGNGNTHSPNKADAGKNAASPPAEQAHHARQRFKDLKLAEVGKILLKENGSLHGKDIEKLAKAGGFKGGVNGFQNYMPVAFKRDGSFVNIGGNTWKLKESA